MNVRRDERGMILPLAMMVLVVLASLTGALLAIGGSEVAVANNHLRSTQALFLAEAGVEDAFNTLRDSPTMTGTASTNLTAMPSLSGPSPTVAAYGSYSVQYQRVGGNTVRVVSTGTTASGARRPLTAVFTNNFTVDTAILTGGSFTISGSPNLEGNCGTVHSNVNLTVSGNPTVTHDLTATGTYTASGSPAVGGVAGGSQPQRSIPSIVPSEFLAAAKATVPATEIFQLKSNGQVLNGYDQVIDTVSPGGTYRGWTYNTGTPVVWAVIGNTGYDGTYYVEGRATISGNPGNPITPWRTTVIASGDVVVTGGPEIQAHLADTLLVAGADVSVSGNPTLGFNGLIAAHEQIAVSGSAEISGYLVAEGATSVSGTIAANQTGGNARITFNCSMSAPLRGTLRVLAWGI